MQATCTHFKMSGKCLLKSYKMRPRTANETLLMWVTIVTEVLLDALKIIDSLKEEETLDLHLLHVECITGQCSVV